MHVLISGASIAGPALAYWLGRHGIDATVVERAPALRRGGAAVDFRGDVHLTVLRRMGLLEELKSLDPGMEEMVIVDADGRPVVSLPAHLMSGDVEVERGDLAEVLYRASRGSAEYVFGDWITSLTQTADGVDVTFANREPGTYDLVVGADGLHSGVRRLAWGPEADYRWDTGYYFATFSAPNNLGLDHSGRLFNVPGKLVSVGHTDKGSGAMLAFASEPLDYDHRDVEQQRRIVAERFAGLGWEVPALLDAARTAPDFYFDSLSQIHLDRWSNGRIALLGDAAWAPSLGGLGNGLAVVGAYVLAGELAGATDHSAAFARFEQVMRPYVEGCQKQGRGAGPFLAPPTAAKIKTRNRAYRMLNWRPLAGFFNRMTTKAAAALDLPEYPVAYERAAS
ncbi:FAD-dependent monooxygenase [Cryptosporangium aurantiacum]|uniref:2-polyprenyl-6-methoxyphenol hydroxylase n=1 Tax=Cryptosporangium aurantiacum TaxID=134849 RepID=A0A1M7QTN6_9ACTN|nr:FAD-dependent monooxygenase [Cryptosporangium aurantiacum]SHN35107.1 2-polyprenyl-6-methoxyphenol hydroxylase [Cryptosporangium aurantiacum]